MSVTVNHFNLGKNYEALFVCPEIHKTYFLELASYLEINLAVKSDVFCYDSEKLSFKAREKLKKSKNVIFVLTSGATEKAAAEKDDEFRQVYGYVWKSNPHSLSLMAINDCHLGYGIEYPEEMQSFKWLHRKKYDLSKISSEEMAWDLYGEFRLGFNQSENRRIEKLAATGIKEYTRIYHKSARSAQNVLLYGIVSLVAALAVMYFSATADSFTGLLVLISFASAIIASVAVGFLCFGIMHFLYARTELANVSLLFSDFIRRSLQRIAALIGIGLWGGICYGAFQLLNAADKREIDIRISIIYFFVMLITIAVVWLIYANKLIFAAESSSYYIELCEKRPKIHVTFAIVFAILITLLTVAGLVIYKMI